MITACYIVHYGQEWLNWSIRSIASEVDQIRVFYTPFPSHGHETKLKCPETEQSIMASIPAWLKYSNFYWHTCDKFYNEGQHREFAVETCAKEGADIVLVVDADELWDIDVLLSALLTAMMSNHRTYRIGMRHFWRSLDWVCDDAAMPTRIIKPAVKEASEMYLGDEVGKVYHMGYAQSEAIIRYKMEIHGHKNEWRPEWYEERFLAWGNGKYIDDVHPTSHNYWNPTIVDHDTAANIRALCYGHPYLNIGKIV